MKRIIPQTLETELLTLKEQLKKLSIEQRNEILNFRSSNIGQTQQSLDYTDYRNGAPDYNDYFDYCDRYGNQNNHYKY